MVVLNVKRGRMSNEIEAPCVQERVRGNGGVEVGRGDGVGRIVGVLRNGWGPGVAWF